jgi:hypothetical protein
MSRMNDLGVRRGIHPLRNLKKLVIGGVRHAGQATVLSQLLAYTAVPFLPFCEAHYYSLRALCSVLYLLVHILKYPHRDFE